MVGIGINTPNTALHVNGGQTVRITEITADYTITNEDYIIAVTQTSPSVTITLPTPTNGRILTIKDQSGTAGTNNITITGGNIDGSSGSAILTDYGKISVYTDGTSWFTI